MKKLVCLCIVTLLLSITVEAQSRHGDYSYNDSYHGESSDSDYVESSPKDGWSDSTLDNRGSGHEPFWMKILLWAPNRVMDFIDIFRIDVGVGPSIGAVVHATEYGQVGARFMLPESVRFGLFGRQSPLLIERSNEYGLGPAYVYSKQRRACKGQVGLGLDLFIVGANAGICLEEVADFVAGIFFFDIMNDDAK